MDKENIKQTNGMLMKAALVLCFIACFTAIGVGIITALTNGGGGGMQNTTGDTNDTNTDIKELSNPDENLELAEFTGNSGNKKLNETNDSEIEEAEPLPTQDVAPAGSSCGGLCGSPSCGAARGGSCGCGG